MRVNENAALGGAATGQGCYNRNSTSERWRRVTPRERCPVCGRGDWCRVSPDGSIAGCMRVSSGAFRTAPTRIGDMHLHRMREDCPSSLRIEPLHLTKSVGVIASVDHRHAVFTAVLESLTLSQEHADYLTRVKRLSCEAITRNLYATVPEDKATAAALTTLSKRLDVESIPGIYRDRDGGAWRMIAREGELLIPVRDHRARIVALRRRTGDPARKYLYASGHGLSAGAPLHFALAYLAELHGSVIVTEGELKADAIADLLHSAVIGIPGVASFGADFARVVRECLPTVKHVSVAFDADSARNPHVAQALDRLLRTLDCGPFDCEVLQWDESSGKGLDDVLAANAAELEGGSA